jgi:hypothetical protein
MKTINYIFLISIITPLVLIINIGHIVEGFTAVRTSRPTNFVSISLNLHTTNIQEEDHIIRPTYSHIATSTGTSSIEADHIMQSKTSFRVKSCWSKAGIGTCFILEEQQHKKFEVVFDLGW